MTTARRDDPPALSPAWAHYLVQGCWAAATEEERLELYLFSAQVFRGNLAALERVWQEHGATVKARHPAQTFTEAVLKGEIPRVLPGTCIVSWEPFGRLDCEEHPTTSSSPTHRER